MKAIDKLIALNSLLIITTAMKHETYLCSTSG